MNRWAPVCGLILILATGVIATGIWLRSRPSWRLSAQRTDKGSIITVTTTASEDPVYRVVIKGWQISQPISRLSRDQVAASSTGEVETLFWDDTVPPGRWTLRVGGVKVDVMEARLVVNDSLECGPGGTLEVDVGQQQLTD